LTLSLFIWIYFSLHLVANHRLNGSSSPVLTATSLSYGKAKNSRQDTFQKRIALKPIKIDIDKLHMKFLALNIDFDGLSLDFLRSRKPAH